MNERETEGGEYERNYSWLVLRVSIYHTVLSFDVEMVEWLEPFLNGGSWSLNEPELGCELPKFVIGRVSLSTAVSTIGYLSLVGNYWRKKT